MEDKFTQRAGCKGVIPHVIDRSNLGNFGGTEHIPDILLNTSSIPTRMTMRTLREKMILHLEKIERENKED